MNVANIEIVEARLQGTFPFVQADNLDVVTDGIRQAIVGGVIYLSGASLPPARISKVVRTSVVKTEITILGAGEDIVGTVTADGAGIFPVLTAHGLVAGWLEFSSGIAHLLPNSYPYHVFRGHLVFLPGVCFPFAYPSLSGVEVNGTPVASIRAHRGVRCSGSGNHYSFSVFADSPLPPGIAPVIGINGVQMNQGADVNFSSTLESLARVETERSITITALMDY